MTGQGILYVMATPLGNLEDLTLRGARLFKEAAVIAAEDTRRTRKIVNHLGSKARLISYREQNHARILPKLLGVLEGGDDVILVSDAGTPGISDPGAMVVKEAAKRGFKILPIPGPSAVATALSVSGLPSDTFYFAGFLPSGGSARRSALETVKSLPCTLVFFEAPHRLVQFLEDAELVLGDRSAALGREMTKLNEEYLRGTISKIAEEMARRDGKVRGEITIVVSGSKHDVDHELSTEELEKLIREDDRSIREIVRDLSGLTALARSELYRLVLRIKGDD
jgi:16S rRNA (cytidine1402-2'-O)-methyltransferase